MSISHVQPDPEAEYTVRKTGQPFTKEHRTYIGLGSKLISAWHHVPLYVDKTNGIVNMVGVTPRWSNIRMEIARDEFLTPLRQCTKNDKMLYVPNIFPHKGYPWNYGALPQTWLDPNLADPQTHIPGDDNPLDVCELGGDVDSSPGVVKQVKVLGAFAVIEEDEDSDDGETDWKLIVVDAKHPLAGELRDVNDVERHMPGYLETMKEWFRVWRMTEAEGKTGNRIALEGEIKGKRFACALIERCHNAWNKVVTEPTLTTKTTMGDIGIEINDLRSQISKASKEAEPDYNLIDRHTMERVHYLAPNWPLAASCPGSAVDL